MKLADDVLEELWFREDDQAAASAEASRSLAAKLAEVEALKTFPAVAQQVLALLAGPEFSMAAVSHAIEEDPALAAGVLRLANSVAFAGVSPSTSVHGAAVRLGARNVRQVVAGVATMSLFRECGAFGRRVRDHMAATAAVVQTLAREVAPDRAEGIFLAGLLHDVGKLLLVESGEGPHGANVPAWMDAPDAHHVDERRLLGYDHAVLGGHVLALWHMPHPIPRAVAWHHQPTRAFEDDAVGSEVALLRVADALERRLGDDPDGFGSWAEELAAGPDATYLGLKGRALDALWPALREARDEAFALFPEE